VKLSRARELHAGIVLIEQGGLLRNEQIKLLRDVIVVLTEHGAMINELLHVESDGSMTFEMSPL
jgi:hypothetical protein